MKSYFISALVLLNLGVAYAVPHLDLEMESSEYRALLKRMSQNKNLKMIASGEIERSLKLGERLSKWVAYINSYRTAETAIRLTSSTTRRGIPIETPNVYNPKIIADQLEQVLADMPAKMKEVITTTGAYPNGEIGIDDETFIKHGRLLDRNYQSAARYKSLSPYRMQYQGLATNDVRGYHYLNKNKIGKEELRDVALIPEAQLPLVKDALTKICMNSRSSESTCRSRVEKATTDNKLADIYSSYYPSAKKIWDNFFVIPVSARRRDVTWANNIMTVPFNTPSIPKFIPYLQNNIEDEFRWDGWAMKLNFGTFANGPLLVFQAGVVPHVNGLGGNEIVMDSNQPIEEYESQWTIRHEFGHVIGLPDCYHEFYDTKLDAFVNYQLDITDLMCSRAGNMNGRIYKELKGAYSK